MAFQRHTPMDTGHSWLIFFSSFMINFLSMGQLFTFGIYFVIFSDHFQIDKKTTSLIGSICFAVTTLVGPIAGIMQKRYGARLVVITGGLLSTLGMSCSYFAKDFWHLYISYGFLVGLGYGLVVNPAMSIIPEYFEKHRYLVLTLMSAGGSTGALVLAPFTLFMIETYAWQGSMLINAGLCMQIVVFGLLLKSRLSDKNATIRQLMNMAIFKDYRYVLLLIDAMLICGSSFVVFSTIIALTLSRGLSTWQSATLISIISLSTTIARIVCAPLSSLKCIDRLVFYTLGSLSSCVGVIGCIFAQDFWTFAICLFIFGFSFGIKVSQLVNVLIDLVGVHAIAVANGYMMFAIGIGALSIPLTAGWLADQTGAETAFLFIVVTIGIGFCCCCVLLALRRKHSRTDVKLDTVDDDSIALAT